MKRTTDVLLAILIPSLVLFYLTVAPYSKVEESFNTQATHDILAFGLPFRETGKYLKYNYDHLTFTGPVPRTFVGSLALAGASWPFAWLVHGVDRQMLVRAILGFYNACCLISYRNAVLKIFGRETANWYLALQACQFHIMFWSSRTLPNFFAFGLSTYALRLFIPQAVTYQSNASEREKFIRNQQMGLTILTVLGIIFRSEIAVLLFSHAVYMLLTKRLTLLQTIPAGLTGAIVGLSITIPIDSFFWQRFPLWPEMTGFIYNILDSQASNWGESPWHFYFTSSLPKLLFNPMSILLLLSSLILPSTSTRALSLTTPNLLFIAIYSLVPHKEWRFIIYAIPPLTAASASAAHALWLRGTKSPLLYPWALLIPFSIALSLLASLAVLLLSTLNYPGAEALSRLHALAHGTAPTLAVHLDTLTCQTGVTRFLQIPDPRTQGVQLVPSQEGGERTVWTYDKTDNETVLLQPRFWQRFDYVLAESVERVPGSWEIVGTVKGFEGAGIARGGLDGVEEGDKQGSEERVKRWRDRWEFGEGPWAGVERALGGEEGLLERFQRLVFSVTGGKGIEIRMRDSIYILKKTKGPEDV